MTIRVVTAPARSTPPVCASAFTNNVAYNASTQKALNELEFKLSRGNYKNGQILGAWIPSARLYLALNNLDRLDIATGAIGVAVGNDMRGDKPLYSGNEVDIPGATHAINLTYSKLAGVDIPFPYATRRTSWELNVCTVGHDNRDNLMQEIMYNINKSSGINLWRAGAGTSRAAFTALRPAPPGQAGADHNGQYRNMSMIIPRGTRIRLKTFRHIGIKKDLQCLGDRAANYSNPQVLADCKDFNWGEYRGRFPYQLIQPRGDNFSGKITPSGQSERGFMYEDAIKNIQLSTARTSV